MRSTSTRRNDDEDESVFVSMTDMTISFLFIVMILLAFFASQLRNQDTVPRSDFEQVRNHNDLLKEKVAELDWQVLKLTERNAEIKQKLNRSNADLENVRKKRDQLLIDVAELQKEIRLREDKIANLQQQLNSVASDLEKATKKRDQLAIDVADLETKIKQRDDHIADLEAKLKALEENPIERYLQDVSKQRKLILENLTTLINFEFPELNVAISPEGDALRFMGEGLFPSGLSELPANKRRTVERIASRLSAVLPCYTLGRRSSWSNGCNAVGAAIEAIQIEGHTDSTGPDDKNLALSTNRANATFFAMTSYDQSLVEFLNNRNQPVLSVAGYGKMRPIADNKTEEGRQANRRIDLRIIMYTPQSLLDIEKLRNDLRNGVRRGAP